MDEKNGLCRHGFTLIEVMVVLFIFTIVIGASYLMMDSGEKSWHSGDAVIQLQEDIRQAINDMVYELSEASASRIIISAGGNSIAFQTPVDEAGSGSWEDINQDAIPDFYLEDTLDANNDIRWGGYLMREDPSFDSVMSPQGPRANRQVLFVLVGDEIKRRVLDPTGVIIEDITLVDDVSNLTFSMDSNGVITINIITQRQSIDQNLVIYSIDSAVLVKNNG